MQASIPGGDGMIHGCYDSGGTVKVIDTSKTASCPKSYTALNWNQTGPQGGYRATRGSLGRRAAGAEGRARAHRAGRATPARKDHRGRWA